MTESGKTLNEYKSPLPLCSGSSSLAYVCENSNCESVLIYKVHMVLAALSLMDWYADLYPQDNFADRKPAVPACWLNRYNLYLKGGKVFYM